MICKKCGADLPDSAVFCPACGTWVEEKAPPKPAAASISAEEFLEEPEAPPKENKAALFWKNKKKRDLLLSILTVVIAALSLTASIILDNPNLSPANVVTAYVDASYRQDQQKFLKLIPPEVLSDAESSGRYQAVLDSIQDNFWDRLDGGYRIRILSQEVITDSSADVIVNNYKILNMTVLQAQKVTVETTYSLYGEDTSVENDFTVVQLEDGKWYFDLYTDVVVLGTT